jgi:hypothetical protein
MGSTGMSRIALAAVCAAVAACSGPASDCKVDGDCASYAWCDVELGRCVFRYCESDSECGVDGRCDTGKGHCAAGAGGEDGGEDGGFVCDPACAAQEECAGSACEARYTAVELVAPQAGTVGPGSMVEVRALLVLASGRTANPPETLAVTLTPPTGSATIVTLTKGGAEYAGTATLGTEEGGWTVRAQYEAAGLTSGEVTLTVDATPPVFTVTVPPATVQPAQGQTTYADPDAAFTQAWKRDQVVPVRVTSTAADVDATTVTVKVRFGTAAELSVPVTTSNAAECGGAAWCGLAEVELWKPEMNAFRGDLTVRASGKDVVGNLSAESTGVVKVTRWKWVHEVPAAPQLRAAPAVADNGRVIFGTVPGGTTGSVVALDPDGMLAWSKPLGAVESSPSIGAVINGKQRVYVAANAVTTGRLYAINIADDSEVDDCPPASNSASTAGVGLMQTLLQGDPASAETGVAVFGGTPSLVALRPDAAVKCAPVGFATETANYPAAVSAKGPDAFFGDSNGSVRAFTIGTAGWSSKWTVNASLFTNALAIVGAEVVGGGGGPGTGGVFTIPIAGNPTVPSWSVTTSSPAWNPVVGTGDLAWVGLNNKDLFRVPLGGMATTPVPALLGVQKGAPLLGEGGRIYLATMDGTVSARSQASPATSTWSVSGLGQVEASPNIDCARDSAGAKKPGPGTLYVASNSGKLYAFHVDSRGLDTTAPWPKWQRDPRNTGNADMTLAQFAAEFGCP